MSRIIESFEKSSRLSGEHVETGGLRRWRR